MNGQWLTRLAPPHAPPPPSLWPPAPGWWLLAALALALPAIALWWWRNPPRRRRRAALRELGRIRAATDPRESARAIESLLRRYAMTVFGRERVARLAGAAWLEFLGGEGGEMLGGEPGRDLLAAAFGGTVRDRRAEWLAGAERFVRQARDTVRRRR
jgi:hypothetical protein